MKKLLPCILLLFVQIAFASQTKDEYRYLDDIALKTGADKGSHFHNYTEAYAVYFSPLKDKPIKFLEIGINEGSSVKLWEEYFKNAELHFIDITLANVKYHSNKSHYHVCDQESVIDLQRFIQTTKGEFDVILDDGGHTMHQQITSFSTLFPHLKSGGIYVIEDLHTSYWPAFGGGGDYTTVNFLKELIDAVNYVGATTLRASHLAIPPTTLSTLNIYQEKIHSMHFYDSTVIIIKR